VDQETRELLLKSKENDFYLSNLSPLGVPFNTVRGTSNEIFRQNKNNKNRYGSSCPKKLLALVKSFHRKEFVLLQKNIRILNLRI